MRHLIRIAVLAAVTQASSLAYAQSDSGTKAGTYNAAPGGGMAAPGYQAGQLNPANCGTPDNFKPCGPMPTKALKHYPGN